MKFVDVMNLPPDRRRATFELAPHDKLTAYEPADAVIMADLWRDPPKMVEFEFFASAEDQTPVVKLVVYANETHSWVVNAPAAGVPTADELVAYVRARRIITTYDLPVRKS